MRSELVTTFCTCLGRGDSAFLLPIYYVGGTAAMDVSSEQIAAEARTLGASVDVARSREELADRLARISRPGDTVLVMGARDDTLSDFAHQVARRIDAPDAP